MMKLYLTSIIGGSNKQDGIRIPCELNNANGFVDHLKQRWTNQSKCLLICSDPTSYAITDSIKDVFFQAFNMTGLSVSAMDVCDARFEGDLSKDLHDYQVVILAGGHVPTQNAYFDHINLRSHISSYKGIVIAISAGSMNSASLVYAQPEHEGEATDPTYCFC